MTWFILTLVTCLVGTHVTYWLTHARGVNSIRAASLASLVFIGLAYLSGWPTLLDLQPAFFGSTFCAMSEPHRLSERRVLIAGTTFAVILALIQAFGLERAHGGVGGVLGGTAFVSCLFVYAIGRIELRRRL